MREIIFIGCGGAIGAVLRYLTISQAKQLYGGSFPVGTLFVNVVGSFLLGVLVALPEGRLHPELKRAIGIGILGALTTFSTFALETIVAAEERWSAAMLNVALNVTLAIAAAILGRSLTRWFL